MLSFAAPFAGSSLQLSQRCNSRSASCARAARVGCLALSLLAWTGVARAQSMAAEPPSDAHPTEEEEKAARLEIAGRVVYGDLSVGMLGAGLEGVYMTSPHLGFGLVLEAFRVDNGADPHYSPAGTLSTGLHSLAFVEGDLLPGWFSPYARAGLGVGRYHRFQELETKVHVDFVGQLTGGVAVRGGPFVARLAGSPSLYGKDFVMAFALTLGGRV